MSIDGIPEVSMDFFKIMQQKKKKYDDMREYYENNPDKLTAIPENFMIGRNNEQTLQKWMDDFEMYKQEQMATGKDLD